MFNFNIKSPLPSMSAVTDNHDHQQHNNIISLLIILLLLYNTLCCLLLLFILIPMLLLLLMLLMMLDRNHFYHIIVCDFMCYILPYVIALRSCNNSDVLNSFSASILVGQWFDLNNPEEVPCPGEYNIKCNAFQVSTRETTTRNTYLNHICIYIYYSISIMHS